MTRGTQLSELRPLPRGLQCTLARFHCAPDVIRIAEIRCFGLLGKPVEVFVGQRYQPSRSPKSPATSTNCRCPAPLPHMVRIPIGSVRDRFNRKLPSTGRVVVVGNRIGWRRSAGEDLQFPGDNPLVSAARHHNAHDGARFSWSGQSPSRHRQRPVADGVGQDSGVSAPEGNSIPRSHRLSPNPSAEWPTPGYPVLAVPAQSWGHGAGAAVLPQTPPIAPGTPLGVYCGTAARHRPPPSLAFR